MRRQRSLRLPEQVDEAVEHLARRTGRDFSAVVNELLDEALKMRRIPGIVFVDGPRGRVAKIGGTGLAVFEIVRAFRNLDSDWASLRQAYHWLSESQLRSALAFAEAYSPEVERDLNADEAWLPEHVWRSYPFMRPAHRA